MKPDACRPIISDDGRPRCETPAIVIAQTTLSSEPIRDARPGRLTETAGQRQVTCVVAGDTSRLAISHMPRRGYPERIYRAQRAGTAQRR